MADSTKKLLAASLRTLMPKRPLSRITVGDICELSEMNRKSFYYHFHDKYELVNWMFRHELQDALEANPQQDALLLLCACLHSDVGFYRTALQQTDQNPLCLCIDEELRPILAARMPSDADADDTIALDLCAHAVRSVIVRWVRGGCPQDEIAFIHSLYQACSMLSAVAR